MEKSYEWMKYHDFSNFTEEEVATLKKAKLIQETSSKLIVMLDGLDEEQIREVIKICKGKKGVVIKLLPAEVNKLLSMNIRLNPEEFNVAYSCNTVAQAPLEVIEQLGVRSVLVGALENNSVQEMSKEKYKQIYVILQDIVKEANRKKSEYARFITVYKKLARTLTYDGEQIEREEKDTQEDDKTYNCRNLENGLLQGKCVCVGYSEILKQVLSLLNIDSKICLSEVAENGETHSYNQVKIDGIWYNTDLTWDSENMKKHKPMKYCLKSDKDFRSGVAKEEECLHYSTNENVEVCTASYETNKNRLINLINKVWDMFRKPKKQLMESQTITPNKFRQKYMQKVDTSLINTTKNEVVKQKENNEMEK